ncbi:DegT/DnrJ/EryC1/StrS family aminotransferase [Halostagnicola bangensis]
MSSRVPLYKVENVIGDEVLEPIGDVLQSGWLTLGPWTEKFEERFAARHDAAHGVAVNSCTSALYASLRAGGIGPGDNVIVPAITFAATANVVRHLGAEVIVCDVKDNGNIDPTVLGDLLERYDVSAIVPVHLYGLPCDMHEIVALAREHDATVIEDCAHVPGAELNGKAAGSFGKAGCFSFYATKNMTTGEGGMIVTDDEEVANEAKRIRNHYQTKSPAEKRETWGYDVDGIGLNFRMSEIEAAIGLGQLDRLESMNESRRTVANAYIDAIEEIPGITWNGGTPEKTHVFHLFVVQVLEDHPLDRDQVYDRLSDAGITTGVHYPPIPALSSYSAVEGEYGNAERFAERILSVPMYPDMSEDTQQRVVRALEAV